jgi:acyl-CoA thioesterase FadM
MSTLEPTLLASLVRSGAVTRSGRGLFCVIQQDWCAPGESRIGYSTIIRLAECIREIHWELDVKPTSDPALDSITRSLNAQFIRPISVGATISGNYRVTEVRPRSYQLEATLIMLRSREILATVNLDCVFWDAEHQTVSTPSRELLERLRQLGRT